MLKRARGTASYQDVRTLIQLWLYAKRIRAILDGQNERLFEIARDRDTREVT